MLKFTANPEPWPSSGRLTDMTARRTPSAALAGLPVLAAGTPVRTPGAAARTPLSPTRKPLIATAAVLITLLIGLLPSSAVLVPTTGMVLGQVTHHHLTVPGIVRAEVVAPDLHPDAVLWAGTLVGLALLGWVLFRPGLTAVRPVLLPVPAGRDPPPTH
jgi:hypothetical protein